MRSTQIHYALRKTNGYSLYITIKTDDWTPSVFTLPSMGYKIKLEKCSYVWEKLYLFGRYLHEIFQAVLLCGTHDISRVDTSPFQLIFDWNWSILWHDLRLSNAGVDFFDVMTGHNMPRRYFSQFRHDSQAIFLGKRAPWRKTTAGFRVNGGWNLAA